LPFVPRFATVLLAFVPIYLANVRSPNGSARPTIRSAFGFNLLGRHARRLPGEYLALLTGYRNLLLVVGALYLVAFLLAPRRGRGLVSV